MTIIDRGREATPEDVTVYLIAGHIEQFLREVAQSRPDAPPLRARFRVTGRYRLALDQTGPREIAYTARADSYALGLLVDYIWTYTGATTVAVNMGRLAGEIPVPSPRPHR